MLANNKTAVPARRNRGRVLKTLLKIAGRVDGVLPRHREHLRVEWIRVPRCDGQFDCREQAFVKTRKSPLQNHGQVTAGQPRKRPPENQAKHYIGHCSAKCPKQRHAHQCWRLEHPVDSQAPPEAQACKNQRSGDSFDPHVGPNAAAQPREQGLDRGLQRLRL
jgi:hypothetical protein